ncbi:hypothetical protein MTO96_001695 [Rhipicephalus appendiculatus]
MRRRAHLGDRRHRAAIGGRLNVSPPMFDGTGQPLSLPLSFFFPPTIAVAKQQLFPTTKRIRRNSRPRKPHEAASKVAATSEERGLHDGESAQWRPQRRTGETTTAAITGARSWVWPEEGKGEECAKRGSSLKARDARERRERPQQYGGGGARAAVGQRPVRRL